MKTTPIRVAAILIAGSLALAGCKPTGQSSEVEFRVPVSAREVGTGSVEDRVVVTGSLRAAEAVELRADTSGILRVGRDSAGRRLREGDRVSAGQVIAEITGEDVRFAARSEATYQRHQSAKRDHESKKELFEEGLMSELEFRPVETELAEARLEWERSQLTESRSRLVTPIDGTILRLARDAEALPLADGQLVTQGFALAQVASSGKLIADVDLVGVDVARVREGLRARVRHHAWEGDPFDGRLLRLAPTLDPATRTLRAEVRVDNRKRRLRPGMFVEVTLIVEQRQDVPVVPREAITERGGSKVVFVLNGQKVSRREVSLGLGDDEIVEIRDGIEVGERVVVRGLETLTDGMKVRVSGG